MDTREFANLLIHAGEQGGMDIRPYPYSGRGMYGAHCVGINADSVSVIVELAYNIGKYTGEDDTELTRIFSSYASDSMGLGVVVYWPQMKIESCRLDEWRRKAEEE